jgi:hypothetical protein
MTSITEFRQASGDGLFFRQDSNRYVRQSNGFFRAEYTGETAYNNPEDLEDTDGELWKITLQNGKVVYTNWNGVGNFSYETVRPFARVKLANGSYRWVNQNPNGQNNKDIYINENRAIGAVYVGIGLDYADDLESTVDVWRISFADGSSIVTTENYVNNF